MISNNVRLAASLRRASRKALANNDYAALISTLAACNLLDIDALRSSCVSYVLSALQKLTADV